MKRKPLFFSLVFGVVGTLTLLFTFASTPTPSSIEPENGLLSGSARTIMDSSASGGSAVQFFGNTPAQPTKINPGAETNYDKLPYTPTITRVVAAVASVEDINAKLNSAQPGDTIEVSDGTIGGGVIMNKVGSASQRIVL